MLRRFAPRNDKFPYDVNKNPFLSLRDFRVGNVVFGDHVALGREKVELNTGRRRFDKEFSHGSAFLCRSTLNVFDTKYIRR